MVAQADLVYREGRTSPAEAYESLAEMGDPQVRYLAHLFASDERRHHKMLTELMGSVSAVADWTHDGSSWSKTPVLEEDQRASIIQAVEDQIKVEKTDANDLKQLRRDLHDHGEGTLWSTIVTVMELDTQKHLQILTAIKRMMKHRPVHRLDAVQEASAGQRDGAPPRGGRSD